MRKGFFTDTDERVPGLKVGTQLTASSYTALCYTVMSQEKWFASLEQGIGIYMGFGLFAGIYIFKACLYFYDLVHSKNKNLSKVATFLREFFAAMIFTLAIIFGTFTGTVLGALSPWFFVASTSIGFIYHWSISLYSAWQWKFAADFTKCQIYKASCIQHTINSILFIMGLTFLSLFLLTQIAPFAFALCNAAFNAGCFILVACMTIKARQVKKIPLKLEEEKYHDTTFATSDHDYYGVKPREKNLEIAWDEKSYLLNEINQKIEMLNTQIKASASHFFKENKKRSHKILSLNKLKLLIEDPDTNIEDFENLLKEPLFHSFFYNPFQSFFRKTSDTREIFCISHAHFKKRKNIVMDPIISFC